MESLPSSVVTCVGNKVKIKRNGKLKDFLMSCIGWILTLVSKPPNLGLSLV